MPQKFGCDLFNVKKGIVQYVISPQLLIDGDFANQNDIALFRGQLYEDYSVKNRILSERQRVYSV